MTYLSRRLREDGFWLRHRITGQVDDLTITLTFDMSKAVRSFKCTANAARGAARAMAEFARLHLDVELDPWQERWVEAAFADPDALRRMAIPPVVGRRWPPVLVTTTPGESSDLAGLVAKVREAGQGTSPVWEWPDEALDFWPRQNGKSARVNREYLGVWPSRGESE